MVEAKEVISGISSLHQIKGSPSCNHLWHNLYISSTCAKSHEALGEASTLLFVIFSLPGPAVLPVASRSLSLETADPRES